MMNKRLSREGGVMLVELLIALLIASMVCGVAYTFCSVYQRHHRHHQLKLVVQQNLSGAVAVIEQQIRMAGYDPLESRQFGIVDVRRYDLVDAGAISDQGQPALFYTIDRNGDGVLEGGPGARNGEHLSFRVQQHNDSGDIFLSYDNGSGRRPLAGNIESMGIAYAVDSNQDGRPDRWRSGSHVIWAVDSDNDNLLDTHIDVNDDGSISEIDDTNGDGRIDATDGAPLVPQIEIRHIKAVRIWLLAASTEPFKGYRVGQNYVVGDRIYNLSGDSRFWRVMETTIDCRNL